jgi:hypothetical protein
VLFSSSYSSRYREASLVRTCNEIEAAGASVGASASFGYSSLQYPSQVISPLDDKKVFVILKKNPK